MASVGDILRSERDARGLSLERVAAETCIRLDFLTALEEGRIEDLPGSTYARGFIQSYARFLEIDPEPLLARYAEEERQAIADGRIDAPSDVIDQIRSTIDSAPAPSERRHRKATLAVAAAVGLALVAGAGWFALSLRGSPAAGTPPPDLARAAPADGRDAGTSVEPAREDLPPEIAPPTRTPSGRSQEARSASASPAAVPPAAAPSPPSPSARPARPRPRPAGESTSAVAPPRPAAGGSPRPAPAPAPDRSAATTLAIPDSGVGRAVVDRELAGRSDRFAEGDAVVFWTRVVGGRRGDVVLHEWYHEGRLAGRVTLSIGGPHWRTYSRRTLAAGARGRWTVRAVDAGGRVLAEHAFVCR